MTTARLVPQTATPDKQTPGRDGQGASADGRDSLRFVLFHALVSDREPRTATSFASEVEARASFARLRSSASSSSEWAELVRTQSGRPSVVAWFGRPSTHTADTLMTWLARAPSAPPQQ